MSGRGSAAVRTFFLKEGFSKIISGFLLPELVSGGLFLPNMVEECLRNWCDSVWLQRRFSTQTEHTKCLDALACYLWGTHTPSPSPDLGQEATLDKGHTWQVQPKMKSDTEKSQQEAKRSTHSHARGPPSLQRASLPPSCLNLQTYL